MSADRDMLATVKLECSGCGLTIHIGDPIGFARDGWMHALCAVAAEGGA